MTLENKLNISDAVPLVPTLPRGNAYGAKLISESQKKAHTEKAISSRLSGDITVC